jgi:hypothetical protein
VTHFASPDERTAARQWRAVIHHLALPLSEDSPAAESSPAEESRSTAEHGADHRINGPFVSDHRRYIGNLSPRARCDGDRHYFLDNKRASK